MRNNNREDDEMIRQFKMVVCIVAGLTVGFCANAILHDEDTVAYALITGHCPPVQTAAFRAIGNNTFGRLAETRDTRNAPLISR
jgi:hypothetical protein